MGAPAYSFDASRFAELLIRRSYPEKTDQESALLRDYLINHLQEFDSVEFSVRIGDGVTPNPLHLPGVQANAVNSSRKRVDMIAWQGQRALLVEIKTVVSHAVMGQLLMDRLIWTAENPDAPEPRLVAVGRRGTPQDIEILRAHGIDVYIYETPDAR